jgi:hypothetical protein
MQECENAEMQECRNKSAQMRANTAQSRMRECKRVQMHDGTKGMMAISLPLQEGTVA